MDKEDVPFSKRELAAIHSDVHTIRARFRRLDPDFAQIQTEESVGVSWAR